MIGIYKITNKLNNHAYIGQSIDIEERWNAHKFYGEKFQTTLQKAFSKYGIDNFSFEVIEECPYSQLDDREIYWIKYYNTYYDGYNMTQGGKEGRVLDYDSIIAEYQITKSIHLTAKNLNIHRESVRRALEAYSIDYNKDISLPTELIMIDPYTLQELKTFPSIEDAADYIQLSDSAIRKFLAGKSKTCGGYFWKRKNDNIEFIPLSKTEKIYTKNQPMKILQYTLDNQLIQEFSSLGQANKAIGRSRSNQQIVRACRNQTEAFGFLWKFKE